jgi:hypothetical protein
MIEDARIQQFWRTSLLPKSFLLLSMTVGSAYGLRAQSLPDAPSALLGYALQTLTPPPAPAQQPQLPPDIAAPVPQAVPCDKEQKAEIRRIPWVLRTPKDESPCRIENPIQEIISARNSPPLTPELKGFLAIRNVADPFNLLTIVGYSGIVIAADSHTAYGPGFAGWGRLSGYSVLEDMQTEFFGTFAIPSLVHEDPRYHRMLDKPIKQRLYHALIHTIISQHDDGRPMLNYATLATYPISAELGNLYVPGLSTNASSTAKRIAAGYATDPVGPLIAEFLPDIAKHIHVRVVFVQEILQKVATNQPNTVQ